MSSSKAESGIQQRREQNLAEIQERLREKIAAEERDRLVAQEKAREVDKKRCETLAKSEEVSALRQSKRQESKDRRRERALQINRKRESSVRRIERRIAAEEARTVTVAGQKSMYFQKLAATGFRWLDLDGDGLVSDSDVKGRLRELGAEVSSSDIASAFSDSCDGSAVAGSPLQWQHTRNKFAEYIVDGFKSQPNVLFDVLEYLMACKWVVREQESSPISPSKFARKGQPKVDPKASEQDNREPPRLEPKTACLENVLDVLLRRYGFPAEHVVVDIFGDVFDGQKVIKLEQFLKGVRCGNAGGWSSDLSAVIADS